MTLKNFTNEVLKSNRIFSREDIGGMSSDDFSQNERAIDYQMQKIGVPSNNDLKNSSDVVYVHAYTRADGTEVRAYYRSKPDGVVNIVDEGEVSNDKFNPIEDIGKDLKGVVEATLKRFFPDNQNVQTIVDLIAESLSSGGTMDENPTDKSEKIRETVQKVITQFFPESEETLDVINTLNKFINNGIKSPENGGIVDNPEDENLAKKLYAEDLKIFIEAALKQIFPDNPQVQNVVTILSDSVITIMSEEPDSEVIKAKLQENILKILTETLPQNSKLKDFSEDLTKYVIEKNKEILPKETKIEKEAKEKIAKLREAFKKVIDFTGDVLHKVTSILPEGFGVRKYFDGLVESAKGLLHMANEPDAAGRFVGNWVKNISDLTGKIVTGKFREIDWIQAAKDSQLSLILTAVNPLLGAVTSVAISGTDLILQATGNSKNGDNKVELGDVLGVVQSSVGMISEVKNVIGVNISKVAEISPNDAQTMQEVYGDIAELENATYKYEKLVNAQLYVDATKEAGKIQTLTQNFMNKFGKGLPTGGAVNVEDTPVLTGGVEYNTKVPETNVQIAEFNLNDAIYNIVLQNLNNGSFTVPNGSNDLNLSAQRNVIPNLPNTYPKNVLPNNIQFQPTNQNFRTQNNQKINELLKLLNSGIPSGFATEIQNMAVQPSSLNDFDEVPVFPVYAQKINYNPYLNKQILNLGINTFGLTQNDARILWNAAAFNDFDNDYLLKNAQIYKSVKDINLPEYKNIIKNKLKSQFKLNDTVGVIFDENSILASKIEGSFEFKTFVSQNINKLKKGEIIKNKSLSFESDKNLHNAFGKIVILKAEIKNNELIIDFLDTYDFNEKDPNWKVKMARTAQEAGMLKPYFIIVKYKGKIK